MKVAFVIFQTSNRANGGVESITKVIEHADAIEPVVVTQLDTPVNERWRRAGAEVHVWPVPYQKGNSISGSDVSRKAARVQSLLTTNFAMYRLLAQGRCRVLHCNDSAALYHTLIGGWLAGVPTVHNIRDTKLSTDVDGIWKWQFARQFLSGQVVLSQEMRDFWIEAFGLTGEQHINPPIDYIYSIVEPEQFFPVSDEERGRYRADLGIPPDQVAVGYVAAVNPKKAQLKFIEQAGPALESRLPDVKIYFVGDFDPESDDYCRRCVKAVTRLGLEDTFEFVGYDSRIVRWYQAVDVGLVASREEGLARCMIESLGCGTPIVSFDVCSAREVLEDYECGCVVEQGDYEGLIERLSEFESDRDLARRCGNAGVNVARKLFSPARVATQYTELYRRLAKE